MPQGSLFLKIFVGFWLVTTAVLGSWMLAAQYFDALPSAQPHPLRHGPPPRFLRHLAVQLQQTSAAELPGLLRRLSDTRGIDVYLLDKRGEEIYGRKPTAAVAEVAAALTDGRRRAFLRSRQGHLVAYPIYRPERGDLRAVMAFKHRQQGLMDTLGNNPWLRVALAVLISGLLCYLLSKLVTRRLQALLRASRKLAAGHLSTRVSVRESGGDETDELARGFNTMAAQLQERITAQKRLLGDVSHELRSPLARLRIALALAEEQPQQSASHLKRMENEAERLDELIGQLLNTQHGGVVLDRHIDLVALLEILSGDATFEGSARHIKVCFEHQPAQAIVASADDLLRKSFENILRNAVAYTAEGTAVQVTLEAFPAWFAVSVEDRGPGIPEAELETIFEPFYRVDSTRSRQTGGHGLGLAIARRAVEQHGGSIRACNTGTGLRVTVMLPAYLP